MNTGSVPFRICLYLSHNPGVALFSDQIVSLFGGDVQEAHMTLRSACKSGWVTKDRAGSRVYYSAGPKLLEAMK